MAIPKNRRDIRQQLLRKLGGGVTGSYTTSGASLVDTKRLEPDNYWNDAEILITKGTYEDSTSYVQVWERKIYTGTLLPALAGSPAIGDTYELHHKSAWLLDVLNDAIAEAIARGGPRTLVDLVDESITLDGDTKLYDLPSSRIKTGVADSGSTTTLADSGLTEADDFWIGTTMLVTADTGTAANVGEVRVVSDFAAATDKLTWIDPLPGAVTTGTTFRIIKYPFDYVQQVYYYDDGVDNWIAIGNDEEDRGSWRIEPGRYPRLRLLEGASFIEGSLRIVGQRFAGALNVDKDVVEVPLPFVLSYAEAYLRNARSDAAGIDPRKDVERAAFALQTAERFLEGLTLVIRPGSKRAS